MDLLLPVPGRSARRHRAATGRSGDDGARGRLSSPVWPRACGPSLDEVGEQWELDAEFTPQADRTVRRRTPRGSGCAPSSGHATGLCERPSSVGEPERAARTCTRSRSWIGLPVRAGSDGQRRRDQVTPEQVARRRVVEPVEVFAAGEERGEPADLGWHAELCDRVAVVQHDHPVGLGEALDAGAPSPRGARRGRLSAIAAPSASADRLASVRSAIDHPDALDGHPVDRVDLRGQQRRSGRRRAAATISSSIARPPPCSRISIAEHVAAHRADAARHLTERTGAVGHPDADDDGDHGRRRVRAPTCTGGDHPVTIVLRRVT